MSEAGPSITVTSVTNALSFGIGILTSTPAIRLFCIYATLGVLIDFIYQVKDRNEFYIIKWTSNNYLILSKKCPMNNHI